VKRVSDPRFIGQPYGNREAKLGGKRQLVSFFGGLLKKGSTNGGKKLREEHGEKNIDVISSEKRRKGTKWARENAKMRLKTIIWH